METVTAMPLGDDFWGCRRRCETLRDTPVAFATLRVSLVGRARGPSRGMSAGGGGRACGSRRWGAGAQQAGRVPSPGSATSRWRLEASPPGWEHLPHRHDLSGLISPPRAGCRPWTSTSHRGDNSEKSVLRCGVVGEGSWTSHRRGDIGAGPCRWRSDPCAWPASAHGLRSVPPFFYRWIVGLSLGPGPDETW